MSAEVPQEDQRIAGWLAASGAYGDAVRSYYAARGRDANDAAVRSAIRTNTELVPQRGDNVLRFLGDLAGVKTLRDRDVLEVGCGFGALASYLTWMEQPSRLVGIDLRTDFLGPASEAASTMGLAERLQFSQADMVQLVDIADGSFDIVLGNNALIYLTSRGALKRALEEFRRVMRPGGALLVYQANRWRPREPFTGDPLVHLLPPRAADALGGITGWRHSHGRVRLLSPPALTRVARQSGFSAVRTAAPGPLRAWWDPRRHVSGFFALGARTP